MRMIWMTADGIDSMLLSKVEKPIRLRVRERYAWTGVAGMYAISPIK
jgi:hypothetical protein